MFNRSCPPGLRGLVPLPTSRVTNCCVMTTRRGGEGGHCACRCEVETVTPPFLWSVVAFRFKKPQYFNCETAFDLFGLWAFLKKPGCPLASFEATPCCVYDQKLQLLSRFVSEIAARDVRSNPWTFSVVP